MAEKRMFSLQIVDSDAFLDMPASTQNLYFHLSMRADDDGFVNNPKKIIRMIGASEDDLKVLVMKRFVLGFPNKGVIVIKHWRINNYLRKDRYHPTQYQEELATLGIKDNGSYTDNLDGIPVGIPEVHQLETENSIDKNSIDKDSNTRSIEQEFIELWKIYPKKQGRKRALESYKRARKNGTTFEEVKKGISNYSSYILRKHIDQQYIKQGSTFFAQNAWLDEYDLPQGVIEEDHELDGIL